MEKYQPRNCVKVIDEMLREIPIDEVELIGALINNREDASYKAPEETLQWQRTSKTLQDYITIPKEEWEFKVLSIFSTMPIEQIKEEVKANQN